MSDNTMSNAEILLNLPAWTNLDRSVAILMGRYDDQGLSNNSGINYDSMPLEAIILGLTLQHSLALGYVCLKGSTAVKKIFDVVIAKSKKLLSEDFLSNKDIINLLNDESEFFKKVSGAISNLDNHNVIKNIKSIEIINKSEELNVEIAKPVIYNRNSFYISRYYSYEATISDLIKSRINCRSGENILFSNSEVSIRELSCYLDSLYKSKQAEPNPRKYKKKGTDISISWQKIVVAMSLMYGISFLCGGLGTDKTTIVAKIIAILRRVYDDLGKELRVVMASPTGHAARRMIESLNSTFNNEISFINDAMKLYQVNQKSYLPNFNANIVRNETIHQLLGLTPGKTAAKFNKRNQIPADVVIINEASMIDVSTMAKLLEGTSKDTRIIFIGDKDQISNIETTSIFGDICNVISNEKDQRFCVLDEQELELLSVLSGENKKTLKNIAGLGKGIAQLVVSNRFDKKSAIDVLVQNVKRVSGDDKINGFFTSINLKIFEDIHNNQVQNSSKRNLYPINLTNYNDEEEFINTISGWITHDISYSEKNFFDIKFDFPCYSSYESFITNGMIVTGKSSDLDHGTNHKYLNINDLTIDENSKEGQEKLRQLFEKIDKFRILAATQEGILGVNNLNEHLNNKLFAAVKSKSDVHRNDPKHINLSNDINEQWFPGKVFLVTRTKIEIGIYAGDTAICGYSKEHGKSHRIFYKSENGIKSIGAHMLSSLELGYVLPIHQSQGSEFEHAMLIFPNDLEPNVTKELIYTGISRSQKYLSICSAHFDRLAECCKHSVERPSNLPERIYGQIVTNMPIQPVKKSNWEFLSRIFRWVFRCVFHMSRK